ncbi:predicted protein [Lichtheimia corymbifera JMRC:FSU:9682]|uniref:Uncharacterized protein n=1 Tax=Lichtheimia corymbifera JMRC:FSU:9682 TaxID=1263082 RepID=A0A068RR12_9FUNG|nr:predicted protein [Lichtheimia corymbifera JMRC:FSU:9682]
MAVEHLSSIHHRPQPYPRDLPVDDAPVTKATTALGFHPSIHNHCKSNIAADMLPFHPAGGLSHLNQVKVVCIAVYLIADMVHPIHWNSHVQNRLLQVT